MNDTKYIISRFPTGEKAELFPLNDSFPVSESQLQDIVTVCNQDAVYTTLFRDMLEGNPYQESNAIWWINWAQEGWISGTHLVWVLIKDDHILGAINLKNIKDGRAEVGYWCSIEHPGYMTNTLNQILDIAREMNLVEVNAWVRVGNTKSGNLLKRSGFEFQGVLPYSGTSVNDTQAEHYQISL